MKPNPKEYSITWYFNIVGKVHEYDDLTRTKALRVAKCAVADLPKGNRITLTIHRHK